MARLDNFFETRAASSRDENTLWALNRLEQHPQVRHGCILMHALRHPITGPSRAEDHT